MLGKVLRTASDTIAKPDAKRIQLGQRGLARTRSKDVQKSYDRIQAEIKWLKENDGAAESIAKREKSLKDMFVTHLIEKKPLKDVKPRKPVGEKTKAEIIKEKNLKKIREVARKRAEPKGMGDKKPQDKTKMKDGGMSKKKKVPVIAVSVGMMPKGKTKMANGGMAYGKAHMYAAGGSVTMNPGLKALKKANPEVFNKITKNA
tara:strand:- start:131 stop:739 length:609 start_codon:yes stop_codon:yes gene_type:complete